jgi:outer membrane lipopolysaccharide assembly protein LptE/RlpB
MIYGRKQRLMIGGAGYMSDSKIFIIFVIIIISCAYSFRSGSFTHSISILPLENVTTNTEIERILSDGLINAFIEDGRVTVKSDGDYILKGVITGYLRNVDSYNSSGEVEEYRINVETKFSLIDESDEINWERNINESVVYSAVEDETVGIEKVAERIKDSLLRIMLDTW